MMRATIRRWRVLPILVIAWLLTAAPVSAHAGEVHAPALDGFGWPAGLGLVLITAAVVAYREFRRRGDKPPPESPPDTSSAAFDEPLVRPARPARSDPGRRRTTARPPVRP